MTDADILLVAINARYSHCSLAIRSLLTHMGPLRRRARLVEFTINDEAEAILASLTAASPRVIGLGVYIWNRRLIDRLVPRIREALPDTHVVLGGPEISHDSDSQLASAATCVIRGEGESLWPLICRRLLANDNVPHLPDPQSPNISELAVPADAYQDEDLQHRQVYVEASRGCPCHCSFCLSALDSSVRHFSEDAVHKGLRVLLDRGCRQLRFVDRSFNLGGGRAVSLLEFLCDQWRPGLRLHFEMTPDGLTPCIRSALRRFPAGTLHIETGIQSFCREVMAAVGRPCDPERVAEGVQWLVREAQAEVHADLIAGLPGESLASFALGVDRLYALGPQEIQLGTLKLLPGAPLARQVSRYGMQFSRDAPYEIEETAAMNADDLETVRRVAAHWERVVNRGHLPRSVSLMLSAGSTWRRFDAFSRILDRQHGRTGFSLLQTIEQLYRFMTDQCGLDENTAREALREDYLDGGRRMHLPGFLTRKPSLASHRLPNDPFSRSLTGCS